MSEEFLCPRRAEGVPAFAAHTKDTWREDGTCSYCGSLNEKTFMCRLEAGDVELGPTDKSYKVYVENKGGEGFKQTYRNCPRDANCTGPDDCTHWVTRDISQTKFYFQHLSDEEQTRFIELLNAKKINVGAPGYFYRLPFFASRAE
ncbi:hypothetical protein AB9E14_23640 [Rhizobium leguminosarum]|uniref:hypothetical protein n=1 Tax=Rhizobium leguminosarum TaxID=384 RepID=UPI003F957025